MDNNKNNTKEFEKILKINKLNKMILIQEWKNTFPQIINIQI